MNWISQGKSDRDIGRILGISTDTVSKHAERIRQKLNVRTRGAAIAATRQQLA
jgi:DNA-binding CsgD family transcriptional regulator